MNDITLENRLTRIEDKLGATLDQTKKTNGHVADAMRDIASLKEFKSGMIYAWIFALTIIVPILGISLYKVWNTKPVTASQIQAAVQAGINDSITQSKR